MLNQDNLPEFEPEKTFELEAPGSTANLHVTARLMYRKIDQYLLTFVFGEDIELTSPVTEMASDEMTIKVGGGGGERASTSD